MQLVKKILNNANIKSTALVSNRDINIWKASEQKLFRDFLLLKQKPIIYVNITQNKDLQNVVNEK